MSRWETTSELEADAAPAAVCLPGARMGHPDLIDPGDNGGSRLVNTIYIEGALAPLWRRVLGPAAARALPEAQRAVVELASGR